jgi:hypothetical protein
MERGKACWQRVSAYLIKATPIQGSRGMYYIFLIAGAFLIFFHKKHTGELLCLYLQVYGTMIALFYIRENVGI